MRRSTANLFTALVVVATVRLVAQLLPQERSASRPAEGLIGKTRQASTAMEKPKQDEPCSRLDPLFRSALEHLPVGEPVTCNQVEVVEEIDVFLREYLLQHAEISFPSADKRNEWEGFVKESYAFTFNLRFPIYINGAKYKTERELFKTGLAKWHWLGPALAPALAHELVHAKGDPLESVAHTAELKLALALIAARKLPSEHFDVGALRIAIEEAKARETIEPPHAR